MPTSLATPTPLSTSPSRGRARPTRGPLARAVVTALRRLDEADHRDARQRWNRSRRLESMLRTVLADHAGAEHGDAVPAVTIACSYLAAGDDEEAYAALLVAHDKLR
ncbi:hypothetical protein [Actinomycetospora sp. TBRC 11914]|uniref:hypothetical protein n=1 Tax=Actinomycetospora sp. TBRC 11914 TaxID=2729387 RepID=UPI00145CC718|nr:hypothetical protein [Actinomycetospora sp. TBRC 11914]NMO91511.1 hypothetical protein [Actinomycetospora sp. TBRC 11914]